MPFFLWGEHLLKKLDQFLKAYHHHHHHHHNQMPIQKSSPSLAGPHPLCSPPSPCRRSLTVAVREGGASKLPFGNRNVAFIQRKLKEQFFCQHFITQIGMKLTSKVPKMTTKLLLIENTVQTIFVNAAT